MLIILSPAKVQNFNPQSITTDYTLPEYINEAGELINELRAFSIDELEKKLKANRQIASKAADSFYNWKTNHVNGNSKQSILAYNGEVFHGLDAQSLSAEDLQYAQKHLRILSGLYGVLRPLDLIQPYRLEMNTKLKNNKGNDLYSFWKNTIPATIQQALHESGKPEILINLASDEYAKTVQFGKYAIPVIDFDFLENKNGVYKNITIYTKKARGLMTRFIIQNQIEDVEHLKGFDSEGYWFNNALSSESKFVFTRK